MAEPIIVPASATRAQLEAAFRQGLLAAAAVATALGANHLAGQLSAAVTYAGAAATIAAFVWGSLKTRSAAKKAAAMADHLPDRIAQTK